MSGAGVVTFSYPDWAAQYPELAGSVAAPQAQGYFNFATLYLDNTCGSLLTDTTIRTTILYMITSHVATILAPIGGNAPSPLVGRLSAATEGSVNVAVEFPETLSGAWWLQTKYGAMAWQALAPWRTAIYVAPPQQPLGMLGFPAYLAPVRFGSWPR